MMGRAAWGVRSESVAAPPLASGPSRGWAWSGRSLVLCLFALTVIAPLGGCTLPGQAKLTDDAAAKAQRLKTAKAAAVSVLADVEACEAAVMAGPSLSDLTAKAARARHSTDAFSRSDSGRLLPRFASAISLAARDYQDCCVVWRVDEEAARAQWRRVLSTPWPVAGVSTELRDYRHPMRYRTIWVKAGIDLGAARLALRETTR